MLLKINFYSVICMQHLHLQPQVTGGVQEENKEQQQTVMMLLYNLEAQLCMTGNAFSLLSFIKILDTIIF
jgi:hypothetical protein